MRHNRYYLFDMSFLEIFEVLTGVGVDVSKFLESLQELLARNRSGVEEMRLRSSLVATKATIETDC